ncbi:MAG: sugar phosphate isomerase/epimerase [Chloroflexi bacterium]|nr:sugar phosphate isomerase/epimerase [Chloroflexota bacterium]
MKIGFFATGVMRRLDFDGFVRWGAEHGFGSIDVGPEQADARAICDRHGMPIASTQGFASQPLSTDEVERASQMEQARRALDLAAWQSIPTVGMGTRRDPKATAAENLEIFKVTYGELARYAESKGVRIVFENWPNRGQNLATTPEAWEAMFAAVPSPALGLCFDPSHLVWQGIDWRRALREFGSRVYHAHAKDTEMLPEGMYRYGVYGPQLETAPRGTSGWFRYRLPGYGVVDWAAYVSTLHEVGFDGALTIEHEDNVWGFLTDPEEAKRGLLVGKRFLEQFVGS